MKTPIVIAALAVALLLQEHHRRHVVHGCQPVNLVLVAVIYVGARVRCQ
jgi:hypothetical protein